MGAGRACTYIVPRRCCLNGCIAILLFARTITSRLSLLSANCVGVSSCAMTPHTCVYCLPLARNAADGQLLWWDSRKLSEPTDSLSLELPVTGSSATTQQAGGDAAATQGPRVLGGSSMEYNIEAGECGVVPIRHVHALFAMHMRLPVQRRVKTASYVGKNAPR